MAGATDDGTAAALDAIFGEVRRWQEQHEAAIAQVQPDSELHKDDAGLGYLQLSHVVTSSLVAAVDELDALRRLVVDAKAVTVYAPLTLIRAGLENASIAVWLLEPSERVERQRRRLALALQDNYDQRQVGSIIRSEPSEAAYTKRRGDIESYAADLGIILAEKGRAFPGYEAVVSSASAHLSSTLAHEPFYRGRPEAALAVWKACSGITHGAQWAMMSLLEHVEVSAENGVLTNSVSSSLRTIASATSVAVDMVSAAMALLNRRRLKFKEH